MKMDTLGGGIVTHFFQNEFFIVSFWYLKAQREFSWHLSVIKKHEFIWHRVDGAMPDSWTEVLNN